MKMLTVDVDTGGTMTDTLVSDGSQRHRFKVDTTPHDYTVCLTTSLQAASAGLGYADVGALLADVGLIRWSSTITTNVLGERRGSKVGLLVSEGAEHTLYGEGPSPVIGPLVAANAIFGLPPNPSPGVILAAVKQLLEAGVRRICVSLEGQVPDNAAERAVKEVIEDQYPDHIIGAVPVLLGSEMIAVRHDQTRTHYSVMNAYTHSQLATSLFKAEDLLRDEFGWTGALLIGHASGGVARIGKTKAVDTIESGPVFGAFGGARMAESYGLDSVVCFDVGGTTTKASIVRGGMPALQRGGDLLGVPVQSSFVMLRSAVVGGGSIARAAGGRLTLGPESAGAAPGPACYGLGGDYATLTDALLVLGYLDPTNFLGGRRVLDAALARATIDRTIAKPLGLSVEEAALRIRDEAIGIMAGLVSGILKESGLQASATPLFSFGGNGPMFAAFVAERLGLKSAYGFDLGPVFSAFGSAMSDVVHNYERGVLLDWGDAGMAELAADVLPMRVQASRDLRGEGFDPTKAEFTWEVDIITGDRVETVRTATEAADAGLVAEALRQAARAGGLSESKILNLRLATSLNVGGHGIATVPRLKTDGEAKSRPVIFKRNGETDVSVHRWESMGSGDRIFGPSLINGEIFTCTVPPGWQLAVDDRGSAHLTRGQS